MVEHSLMIRLKEYDIKPDPKKDQHLMIDKKILKDMVKFGKINKKDVVLEIGAGPGNLTSLLAENAKSVYAVEIEKRFSPLLKGVKRSHKNIKIIWGNFLNVKIPRFNKIVSNIPYSISEPLFQKLIHYDFDLGVLALPSNFVKKMMNGKTLLSLQMSLFFKFKIMKEIDKKSFYPPPRVDSFIVEVIPKKEMPAEEFILREVFKQSNKKLKNALREALIKVKGKTKRETRSMISNMNIPGMLEKKVGSMSFGDFNKIMEKIEQWH